MQDYMTISQEALGTNAKINILKLGDSGEVFYEIANTMVQFIQQQNAKHAQTVFICPVGPTGQYPIFVRLVNQEKVNLKNVWFINMDEYLTDQDQWIGKNHKLSFRGFMEREVYDKISPDLVMPESQRIFPNPSDLEFIPKLIDQLGGVDIAFGGIGINGHIAFNEPHPEMTVRDFSQLKTRIVEIRQETRTTNCISDLGGALSRMPKKCVSIGVQEILCAKKIVLAVFRDWHRAVIREAAYGKVTASFPVSLLQNHPNAFILTNENAARAPY